MTRTLAVAVAPVVVLVHSPGRTQLLPIRRETGICCSIGDPDW